MLERLALALAACGCTGAGVDWPDAGERPPVTRGASTLAGSSEAGDVDGPRDANLFANPTGVALAADGAAYVADFGNGKIRRVDREGTASTVATGIGRPFALALGSSDTLYVASDNDPRGAHGAMTGTIWRVDLQSGTALPLAADIGRPRGLVVLRDGRLAVSDYMHGVIELVDPRTGETAVLAGAWDQRGFADGVGEAARFDVPYGLAQRDDDSLVVADQGNGRLRAIELDGRVTTLVGGLDAPAAVALGAGGDLFVTEPSRGEIVRVRETRVEPIAGDGTPGYADAEDALQARFYGLEGLAAARDGSLLLAGDGNRGEELPYNRIRRITLR